MNSVARPKLPSLRLMHAPFADEALAHLQGSTELAELALQHTRIRGAGLTHLAPFALKHCELAGAMLTAQGLTAVTELTGLTPSRFGGFDELGRHFY